MYHCLVRIAILCGTGLLAGSAVGAGEAKPNIILLLADDLGYADVGFHGCKDIPTPHIDSIARNGIRCTNAYVSGPYCSPTRAGLLTGRYQQRFGHEFNPSGSREQTGLPLEEKTLADRLKAAGYVTGLVGKWHLGQAQQFRPQQRGFDEFYGFLGGAHPYFPSSKSFIFRGNSRAEEKEYLTDAFGREAVSFIDRHKQKPFFLYVSFNAVHTPMQATEDRLKKFASIKDEPRRTYAAMTLAMDDAIGKVLDKLHAEKLEERTLVIFFNDNGGATLRGTTINASSNAPLRGSKRSTLEGGIRVPFAMQWKGRLPAGKIYEEPIIQLDILPTALAAAGVEVKPEWKLDGVNLLPHFTGQKKESPHKMLYWRFGAQMAIRAGDWKLVRYDTLVDGEARAKPAVTPARLYNLAKDIGETTDLAAKHPDKVTELESAWQRWNAHLASPRWGPDRQEIPLPAAATK